MSIVAQLVPRSVTLDELVALNDEIAALARAGVPLDRGLLALGSDLPGRLGKLATSMGQRLEAGESLAAVVANSGDLFPPAYRAVIEAGIRVGNLPAALEDVSRSARRTSQTRWTVGIALLYPLLVLLVAVGLLQFAFAKTLPLMLHVCAEWDLHLPAPLAAVLGWIHNSPPWIHNLVALVVTGYLVYAWFRSGQIARGSDRRPLFRWGPLSSLYRMRQAGQLAALNELLALLVEHGVPLHEALPLAGAALGSPAMERGARELATQLERGERSKVAPAGFPPLLAWTLRAATTHADLPAILRRSAQNYRDEASRQAQWVSIYLPIWVTAVCGGSAVILFAIVMLGPWLVLLRRMAENF